MKIIICEDQAESRNAIAEKVREWMALTGHGDVQISTFSSSKAFLQQWKRGVQADLLFLDIQFESEMDGIELAKEIRLTNDSVPIVFITNYEAYWRDGYEVNALRYLSKPVSYEAIAPCLDIAFRRRQTAPQDFFVLDEAGKRIALRFSEIVYLEAQSPYVMIRTADKMLKRTIRVRKRFTEAMDGNENPLFVQGHRSYIVNLLHVRKLTRTEITLSTGEVLPLSKNCADQMFEAFDAYYQGGGL